MVSTIGQTNLRGENINRAVKGFALKEFKLKQVLLEQTSNKWTETYYRETATELDVQDSGGAVAIKGTPRLASFPNLEPSWTKVQGTHIKFAGEATISMEDKLTDAIDVQARAYIRVARAIAKQVDDYIYTELSGATGINTAAAAATWDNATVANRDPIGDILTGIQYLDEDGYDALENGYLLLSPKDYKNLLRHTDVVNNPSFKTADVVSNGVVGQIAGLKIIKTNAVAADEAMIIKAKTAATWKGAVPLSTAIITDEGIKYTLRAWEIGQCQVTDPEAIHVITNTQT